jgi:hypothetical protein
MEAPLYPPIVRPSVPAKFLLATMLCAFNHAIYIACAIAWVGFLDLQLLGVLALAHIVVMGTGLSFVPRADTTVSRDRRARMAAQGGHTLMWSYFAGFGPLAEFVQWSRGSPAGSGAKVTLALIMHAVGGSLVHAAAGYYAVTVISPLRAAAAAALAAAPAAATTAAHAATATAAADETAELVDALFAGGTSGGVFSGVPTVFNGAADVLRLETLSFFSSLLLYTSIAAFAVTLTVTAGWGAAYVRQAQSDAGTAAAASAGAAKGTAPDAATTDAATNAATAAASHDGSDSDDDVVAVGRTALQQRRAARKTHAA